MRCILLDQERREAGVVGRVGVAVRGARGISEGVGNSAVQRCMHATCESLVVVHHRLRTGRCSVDERATFVAMARAVGM